MKQVALRDAHQPRSPESDHLIQLLMQVGSRAFAYFGAVAADAGLAAPVALALQRLHPDRPGPMNELAGAMGCDPSYVTWIADQLEGLGLAERQPAPHDRRVKVLALTPTGRVHRRQLLDRLALAPFAIEGLSETEAAALDALLTRVLGGSSAVDIDHCAMFPVRHHHNGDQRKAHGDHLVATGSGRA